MICFDLLIRVSHWPRLNLTFHRRACDPTSCISEGSGKAARGHLIRDDTFGGGKNFFCTSVLLNTPKNARSKLRKLYKTVDGNFEIEIDQQRTAI